MTILIRNDNKTTELLKSIGASLIVLTPSLITMMTLRDSAFLMHFSFLLSGLVLLLAAANIGVAITINARSADLARLTTPALMCASGIALLFAITEAMIPFLSGDINYNYLTPFIVGALALTGAAVFTEKSVAMKCYLGLNSAALLIFWALGAAGWFTMPF